MTFEQGILNLRELLRCKCDKLLTLLSYLLRGVSSVAVPVAMALTACVPPSVAQFDEPYVAAPADHAV
ncbi:MAG: hypothetical protein WAV82_14345, partial [Methylobacter sp.]